MNTPTCTIVCVAFSFGLATACGGASHQDPANSGGSASATAGAGGSVSAAAGFGGALTSGAAGSSTGGGPVDVGAQQTSDKLDVLFVVDNSVSMAGKQKVLASSIPAFVSRLANPRCVDAQGVPSATQPASATEACATGKREFSPIQDAHFGVITTSLGSHGGEVCVTAGGETRHYDDQAQLVPSKRTGVASYLDSGYLAFDAAGKAGLADISAVSQGLQATILAAGEDGCGYEAPLEAMYRFLVDPEPPVSVELVQQQSVPTGINDVLLKQRNAFLRPDSSLAIVILSDENDCSIMDSGIGWYVGSVGHQGSVGGRMPRASSACAANPNDPCCRSCAQSGGTVPAGCAPLSEDSVCKNIPVGQPYATWDSLNDSLNLRCFDQKRRFGFDLLYPVERYSDALSKPQVSNRAGTLVDNPLFAARDGKGPRSASLVSVSVLVGAPWQDLATSASLSSGHALEFLSGAGLATEQRWSLLVGDSSKNVLPADAFMLESIEPRSGQNPLLMTAIQPASSQNPEANPINGHEQNNADKSDLQYACTFALQPPIACVIGSAACDCSANPGGDTSFVVSNNSPLCQPPAGGPAGTTQYYGKGYPGTRELRLAQALGVRAVAGSICSKQLSDETSPDFAFKPALNALVGRIASTLK